MRIYRCVSIYIRHVSVRYISHPGPHSIEIMLVSQQPGKVVQSYDHQRMNRFQLCVCLCWPLWIM